MKKPIDNWEFINMVSLVAFVVLFGVICSAAFFRQGVRGVAFVVLFGVICWLIGGH